MVSPSRCGAVCYLRPFAHPVTVARRVMEKLPLVVLLAGNGPTASPPAGTGARQSADRPGAGDLAEMDHPPPSPPTATMRPIRRPRTSKNRTPCPRATRHPTIAITTRSASWPSTSGARWPGPARPAACRSRFRGGWATRRSSARDCTSIRGARAAVCTGVGELVMGGLRQLSGRGIDGPRRLAPRGGPRGPARILRQLQGCRGKRQVAVVGDPPFRPMEPRRLAARLSNGGPDRRSRRLRSVGLRDAAVAHSAFPLSQVSKSACRESTVPLASIVCRGCPDRRWPGGSAWRLSSTSARLPCAGQIGCLCGFRRFR